MSLTRPDPASAAMLAGLFLSLTAVWGWGDAGAPTGGGGTPQPPEAVQAQAPPPPPPPPPVSVTRVETVSGAARAANSATVSIGGRHLPLHGLLPVGHPQAVAVMNDFLASAGVLTCVEAAAGAWSCTASNGVDAGEVAVLSGLAFTGPGASQKYLNAENDAKKRKAGIWGGD